MVCVTTMDSFMPCLNAASMLERGFVRCLKSFCSVVAQALLLLGLGMAQVQAQSNGVQLTDFQIERGEDGVYLNANLAFELPPSLEDALTRGMPVNLVVQATVLRERWYWYDKRISQTERYIRISYQPLSRRWRLMQSAQPMQSSGLGVSLGASYDSLKDALQVVQKINRWKIAELGVLNTSAKQKLDFHFSLDLSQLPQALQFGNLATNDWALELSHSQRLDDASK
jgi:hypothetical protein